MQENNPISTINNPQVTVAQPLTEDSKQSLSVDSKYKANNFLVILLSVLLFASVLIAGFFAYQTQKLVKELTMLRAEPTPIATLEPTTKPITTEGSETDPTANWKTFTNTKYRFSFKYPSNFEDIGSVAGPYSIKSSESVGIRSFSDPLTIREGTDAPFDGFSLYYVDNLNAQSFDEFLVNEKTTMDNAAYASMTGSKRISLNNNGVAYINETRGYYYYPLEGGTKSLVFAYIEKNPNFRIVFNQILSTIKFTN